MRGADIYHVPASSLIKVSGDLGSIPQLTTNFLGARAPLGLLHVNESQSQSQSQSESESQKVLE